MRLSVGSAEVDVQIAVWAEREPEEAAFTSAVGIRDHADPACLDRRLRSRGCAPSPARSRAPCRRRRRPTTARRVPSRRLCGSPCGATAPTCGFGAVEGGDAVGSGARRASGGGEDDAQREGEPRRDADVRATPSRPSSGDSPLQRAPSFARAPSRRGRSGAAGSVSAGKVARMADRLAPMRPPSPPSWDGLARVREGIQRGSVIHSLPFSVRNQLEYSFECRWSLRAWVMAFFSDIGQHIAVLREALGEDIAAEALPAKINDLDDAVVVDVIAAASQLIRARRRCGSRRRGSSRRVRREMQATAGSPRSAAIAPPSR